MSEEYIAIKVTPPSQNMTAINSYLQSSWFQAVSKTLPFNQKERNIPKMKNTAVPWKPGETVFHAKSYNRFCFCPKVTFCFHTGRRKCWKILSIFMTLYQIYSGVIKDWI